MVIESSEGQDAVAPVFVLCTARSGSTLLRYLLDAHPLIGAPPELHLGALCQQLMWVHTYTAGDAGDATPESITAEARRRTRKVVTAIMADYCHRQQKRVWCEKSVASLDYLRVLDEVFPDARLVCLHRHGLDMVSSGLEAERETPGGFGFEPYLARHASALDALVEYWCDRTTHLLAVERAHPDRTLRLRYEDLVQEPVATLRGLCAFLRVPWQPEMLERAFTVEHARGPGDAKIARTSGLETSSIGKGLALPWARVALDRRARLNRLLSALAYLPLEPAGEPSGPAKEGG